MPRRFSLDEAAVLQPSWNTERVGTMYVLMYMCVYVSINVIDTSFLYLVHHIGHMCIMCPVRPKTFALARMHRMNIIMPSVVILAWESISPPDFVPLVANVRSC